MKILHRHSLLRTVDAFNAAEFYRRGWEVEASAIVDWVSERLGKPHSYAGSFALTAVDWATEFRSFTGEKILSRAGRAHVVAEETIRMLAIIQERTGLGGDVRNEGEARLRARVFDPVKSSVRKDGIYCCGTCSLALWRAIESGAFRGEHDTLERGIHTLHDYRDAEGGWGRFPFFTTLLVLADAPPRFAAAEIEHSAARRQRAASHLTASRTADVYSARRRELLQRIESRR